MEISKAHSLISLVSADENLYLRWRRGRPEEDDVRIFHFLCDNTIIGLKLSIRSAHDSLLFSLDLAGLTTGSHLSSQPCQMPVHPACRLRTLHRFAGIDRQLLLSQNIRILMITYSSTATTLPMYCIARVTEAEMHLCGIKFAHMWHPRSSPQPYTTPCVKPWHSGENTQAMTCSLTVPRDVTQVCGLYC